MSTILKDKIKKNIEKRNITPQSLLQVVKNSINGIFCYIKDGKSIILYSIYVLLEIVFGFVYSINGLEWILIISVIGIILSVELLNTAIEATCDAITKKYNPYIKIAKDCGSAATFIIFLVAIGLNIIIFIPKI